MRRFLLIVLIIISVSSGTLYAQTFQKVEPSIEYWYYYYYAPEMLNEPPYISAKLADSTEDHSAILEAMSYKDSDSSDNNSAQKENGVSSTAESSWIDSRFIIPDSSIVYFLDSIPHIRVRMVYTGDWEVLENLGVKIRPYYLGDTLFSAMFPLSILPDLDSMQNVSSIRMPTKASVDSSPIYHYANKSQLDSGGTLYAQTFQKVDLSIEYWYYYYYAPEMLNEPPYISAKLLDSTEDHSAILEAMSYKDSDSSDNNSVQKENGVSSTAEPSWIDSRFITPDSSIIYFVDSIPHIMVRLAYTGAWEVLENLGVKIIPNDIGDTLFLAMFPLSILPDLDSMQNVSSITMPAIGSFDSSPIYE